MAGGGTCPDCRQKAAANPGDEIKRHQDASGETCSGTGKTAE